MIKKSISFNSSEMPTAEVITGEIKREIDAAVARSAATGAIVSKKSAHLLNNINDGHSLEGVWGDIVTSSPAKQIVIGGVSGWCTGYIAGKIGKLVLIVLGGSFIALQVAQSQGVVQIDWKTIEERVSETRNKVKRQLSDKFPSFADQVKDFGARHMYLSGSFCLGLLVGAFN